MVEGPVFSDASQQKKDGFLLKLPRSTRRLEYSKLGAGACELSWVYFPAAEKLRWQERFFIAGRDWLFWSRVNKQVLALYSPKSHSKDCTQEQFLTRHIVVPVQVEATVVFFRQALKCAFFFSYDNMNLNTASGKCCPLRYEGEPRPTG